MSDDMSVTIVPKSNQINADDLISGPRTITITRLAIDPTSEQSVAVFFDGDNGKPYMACKSMRRVMVHAWGADASKYAGQSMTLYRDPSVKFGGMEVGGIRISHMTGLDKPLTMALTATKAKRALFTVKPLVLAREAPAKEALPKPAEPMTLENASTAGGFLDALDAALDAALTVDAVDAIMAHPRVQKALDTFQNGTRLRLMDITTRAIARTAPAENNAPNDDDDFPGDRP